MSGSNTPWEGLAVDSKPRRMELRHPNTGEVIRDAEGNPAFIDLYSSDDPVADHVRRDLYDDVMSPSKGRKNKPRLSMEEAFESQANLMAALTASWYLVDPRTKEPIAIECNYENCKKVYGDRRVLWIREQADEFANDRANFF